MKLEWTTLSLICILASTAQATSQTTSPTTEKRLNSLTGKYILQTSVTRDCPGEIDVRLWRIDYPVIDVLNVGEIGYQVPQNPSFGYPSHRHGNVFSITYGPAPGYDGPACSESADFNGFNNVRTRKACDDGTNTECVFEQR